MKKRVVKSKLTNPSLRLEELLAEERTMLSKERTIWANEQSTLAYVRTGFSALLLGIGLMGLIKLVGTSKPLVYSGVISIILGLFFIVAGLIYYPIRNKLIKDVAE